MVTLKADDDVHGLVYVWYGLKFDGALSMIRFKGRALTEWATMVPLFVMLWWVAGTVLAVYTTDPLAGLVLRFAVAWGAGSWLAKIAHERLIDSDRPAKYAVRVAGQEMWRLARSRGPVDWLVVAAAVPVWWVLARLAILFPLPALLVWAAAVWPAVLVARVVVARFESTSCARRREAARFERSASMTHVEVSP
jgi:hypothetical protein